MSEKPLKEAITSVVKSVSNAVSNATSSSSNNKKKTVTQHKVGGVTPGGTVNLIKSSNKSSSGSSTTEMSQNDKNAISIAQDAYRDAAARGDTAGMEAAHKTAENIRAKYGYSGGADGSQYIATGGRSSDVDWSKRSGGGGLGGTSTDYGTYKSDLDRLTQAQRQAQVDQLKAARTRALQNLDAQEQNIKPLYQTARNQTSAASQQGARNFAEYLANRGLTNSGASAQGEINRLSTLQNNLGNINTQEANAYRDIANQRTAVENDYAANLANANNAITQQYYNNLLNYNEQQRQYVQALQQQALGQYANDYQAYKNSLLAQGYSPNSLEVLSVDAARGNKVANQYAMANTASNALASIQAGNINYNNAAALGWTVPQAQAYYQNYVAAQIAAEQQAAEQQAYEREQQEWTNNLKYEQYLNDKAKTEAEIRNINSQIANRNANRNKNPNSSVGNQLTLKEVESLLEGYTTEERKAKIDSWYNNNLIPDWIFDVYQ